MYLTYFLNSMVCRSMIFSKTTGRKKIAFQSWISHWMRNGTWSKSKNFGEGNKNKPGFPKQPDWFIDARGLNNIESGLKQIGFSRNVLFLLHCQEAEKCTFNVYI